MFYFWILIAGIFVVFGWALFSAARKCFGVIGACVCVLAPLSISWVGYQVFFDSYREIIVNHEEVTLYRDFMREINRYRHMVDAEPNNRSAWIVLAKSYQLLGDYGRSAAAFQEANALMSLPPNLNIEWVRSMLMGNQGRFSSTSVFVLQEAIKEAPENLEGAMLMGHYHFQNKDYPAALQLLREITTRANISAETRSSVANAIAQIQEKLAQQETFPNFGVSQDKSASKLEVVVDINENLRPLWQQGGILIVYVQDEEGSRVPRAVKRFAMFSLPLKVVLSDRDAILPSSVLSALEKGVVIARINSTGAAFAEVGDLFGQASIEPPKIAGWQTSVHVLINQVKQ